MSNKAQKALGVAALIAMPVCLAAVVAFAVIHFAKQGKIECEQLRQLYGPGRCVRADTMKIILSDGTVRYLPYRAERE